MRYIGIGDGHAMIDQFEPCNKEGRWSSAWASREGPFLLDQKG
jgi:hypothetical protein